MVDFQERDTHRGIGERTDESDETADSTEDETEHESTHHDHAGPDTLGVAILTVSSSRTLEDDPSGDRIAESCRSDGHEVVTRELVADDFDRVQGSVDSLTRREDTDVVITTGGTGVTPDDVTIEATHPLFEKSLPGFGELFRQYSEESIGTRVIATRSAAGIADGVPVFCLPGSEDAVHLGTEEIILPEADHLVGLAMEGRTDESE